ARVAQADLVFINGLELEGFLQGLLNNASGHGDVIHSSEGIDTIDFEGEEFSGADPHVWTNPLNAKVWADNIAEALAQKDPANANAYLANAESYKAELDELDRWAIDQITQIPADERVLVTDHDAFAYFADHYGFQIVGALIPSYSTQSEASGAELADLETAIQQYDVKAIFVGVSLNPILAERVAADTGVKLVTIYTESLSNADGLSSTYLDMIRFDVQAIVEALK
ncbi:MAG TPA: metal ABC transporter substrate-binding protein, partial [Terriglobales bacterium]|nr:metal ABC transporter substrate-binding protein [Terriglobales bacterium]